MLVVAYRKITSNVIHGLVIQSGVLSLFLGTRDVITSEFADIAISQSIDHVEEPFIQPIVRCTRAQNPRQMHAFTRQHA